MKKITCILFIGFACIFAVKAQFVEPKPCYNKTLNFDYPQETRYEKYISGFMTIMGAGIIGIWAVDIATGKFKSQGSFLQWTNEGGDLLWPHILAELSTGALLISSGISLYTAHTLNVSLSLVSLGALAYTSMNSFSWTLADKSRLAYGIPMTIGLVGSIVSISILL